jgi:DNA-binding CsgD family transcriptional regulator
MQRRTHLGSVTSGRRRGVVNLFPCVRRPSRQATLRDVMRPHLLDVVEAAFDLEASDDAWQEAVVDQARRVFPGALGALGYRYRLREGAPVLTSVVSGDRDLLEVPARGHQALDLRHIYRAYTAPSHAEPTLDFHADPVTRQAPEVLRAMWSGLAVSDMFGVYATRPCGESMTLGIAMPRIPAKRGKTYDWRVQAQSWTYLARHIETALTVREALQHGSVKADFALGGAHFEDQAARDRNRLLACASQLERERDKAYLGDASGLSVWQPLMDGRWSMIRYPRSGGGVRFLAVENPRHDMLRRLSALEQSVVELVAAGQPNKLIAAALSLHESSVANLLTRSLRKLGIKRRDHLVILARVLRDPASASSDERRREVC